MRYVSYFDVDPKQWDQWVGMFPASGYLHASFYQEFLWRLVGKENCLTFAVLDDQGAPVALCPLGISSCQWEGLSFREGSWAGEPPAAPVFAQGTPSLRRRIRLKVFEYYEELIRKHQIQRVTVRVYPLSLECLAGGRTAEGLYEMMMHDYQCQPQNNIIMDLRKSAVQLRSELSEFQRKHINRSERQGLTVRGVRGPGAETAKTFKDYQQAHFQAAGRLTRPQESFDWMLELLERSQATLYVEYLGDAPVSYLYCGEYKTMAFGWSQVNVEAYEKSHSPRHNLEWQTFLDYQKRGFQYYEVGTLWYGPQLYYTPTPKEISIAEFKRRYGGVLMGDLLFEKIYDETLRETILRKRLQQYLDSLKTGGIADRSRLFSGQN